MEGLRSKQPQGVSELCERTDEDADRKGALEQPTPAGTK